MIVDICVGLAWGDEGKGKVVSYLSKTQNYDFVCRWNGGNNAGHTIYKNGVKYKTHLIPSGIFYNIKSIIGPDCIINLKSFREELDYLKENGFDISLIKVSSKAHVVFNNHIEDDCKKYGRQGTTQRGIAPCYRDKYARIGRRLGDLSNNELDKYNLDSSIIWDEKLYGTILCEGAQGFWLDINYGNYPYVTSSNTLPYNACSLGFSPKEIRHIYGAAKIYDTRSGTDPIFPEELHDNFELSSVGKLGGEFGTTTGRKRKVNWLNLDKLIIATRISGTTNTIISKVDVLEKLKLFKYFYNNTLITVTTFSEMKKNIETILLKNCVNLREIKFSNNTETINMV